MFQTFYAPADLVSEDIRNSKTDSIVWIKRRCGKSLIPIPKRELCVITAYLGIDPEVKNFGGFFILGIKAKRGMGVYICRRM